MPPLTDEILLAAIVTAVATPYIVGASMRWRWRAPERRARRAARRAYAARERQRREARS